MAGLTETMFYGEGRTERLDAILKNHGVLENAAALETLAGESNFGAHLVLAAANRIVDIERELWHAGLVIGRVLDGNSARAGDVTLSVTSPITVIADAAHYEQQAARHSEARRAFTAIAKLWGMGGVTAPPAPTLADLVREATTHPLVQAVKDHAMRNYNEGGWDVVVETHEDHEIAARIAKAGATTAEQAIAAFAPAVSVWADRQADAVNSAF